MFEKLSVAFCSPICTPSKIEKLTIQRVLCRQPPDETYAYGSGSLADFGDSPDSPMVERMGYEDGKVFGM